MSVEEQQERIVSLLTGIDLNKILDGNYSNKEGEMIKAALHQYRDMEDFIISSDIMSATTVSGLQAKVIQYRPRILCVDGTYLMQDETGNDQGSPQALTQITRGLKRMAQRLPDLTVIQTTQSMTYRAKGGLNLGSIGYSQSFAQDSDGVFGTELVDEQVEGVSKLSILGQRSGKKGSIYLIADWEQGAMREVSYDDAMVRVNSQLSKKPEAKRKTQVQMDQQQDEYEGNADTGRKSKTIKRKEAS